jgi:hypothetical protein
MLAFLLLVAAFSLGTAFLGWWSLMPIALLWALMARPGARAGWLAFFSAGAAWGILLAITACRGPLALLADKLSGIMHVPVFVLTLVVILFPMLLAGSAAGLVTALRGK